MKLMRVAIVRAAGLMGWVADCQYEGGYTDSLLDLDIQARDLPDAVAMAEEEYDVPVVVEADQFWLNKWEGYLEGRPELLPAADLVEGVGA